MSDNILDEETRLNFNRNNTLSNLKLEWINHKNKTIQSCDIHFTLFNKILF